jgi:hypothetical protein
MSQPPFDPKLVVPPQSNDLSLITDPAAGHSQVFHLQQQQQQLLLAGQDQLQQKRLQRLAETIADVTDPAQRILFIQQQLAQQMALLQQKLTEVTQLLAARQPQQGLQSDRHDG